MWSVFFIHTIMHMRMDHWPEAFFARQCSASLPQNANRADSCSCLGG
jgi:hypothetical protein